MIRDYLESPGEAWGLGRVHEAKSINSNHSTELAAGETLLQLLSRIHRVVDTLDTKDTVLQASAMKTHFF